ncbi:MAG: lamin tail domain-containing protein [Cumulibacter sp.]
MRTSFRAVSALAAATLAGSLAIALPTSAHAAAADISITEWMYNPVSSSGEFIEITNRSGAPLDLADWSFDDNSAVAGTVSLAELGVLSPGESAIITESDAATFRAAWNVSDEVKVLGGNGTNLGRADAMNIFNGTTLIDTLEYDDQGSGSIRGPRTQGVSAVPSDQSAIGANNAALWVLSAPGDAEGSWTSTAGDIGSPGVSRFGVQDDTDEPWQDIVINEVSSDNDDAPDGDVIELYNSGEDDIAVELWLQSDSGGLADAKPIDGVHLADDTWSIYIPAGEYGYFSSGKGLSSGGDSVTIYLPDGTVVDTMSYGAGEAGYDESNDFGAGSIARCPDGGDFTPVADKTFGSPNACDTALTNPNPDVDELVCAPEGPEGTGELPEGALAPAAWPGSADVLVTDSECAWITTTGPEGRDISGLVFDPDNPAVLYAVKNKSWVFRLIKDGDIWVPDPSDDWESGKQLFAGDNADQQMIEPDTEGLTIGSDGALYVTTERDNEANDVPLNSILRFDPAQFGTALIATHQWDMTEDFPELRAGNEDEANLGFEGVAFLPDSYLTMYGFVDQSTGETYDPADYPLHGDGLFFGALENDGVLYAYALNSDGSFHRVSVADTGMGHVMDVQYDPATERIWALCDNTCGVVSTLLKIGASGTIVPDVAYAKPAGLPNNNVEGFALAPATTCDGGVREAVWSDDGIYGGGPGSDSYGHALYSGTVDCDLELASQGVGDANTSGPDGTDSEQPIAPDSASDSNDDATSTDPATAKDSADDPVTATASRTDPNLAATGFEVRPYAWAAALLLGLGSICLLAVRRRST